MARALRTAAIVAGVVALAATGIGAVAGSLAAAGGAITASTAAAASAAAATAATAAGVASVATTVAIAASLGSAALQKRPPAQGSSTEIRIGANLPTPYMVGRTYNGGNLVHDVGYGSGSVDNPFRAMVLVWSLGPIQSIEALKVDFATVTFSAGNAVGYYNDYLFHDRQLGACPEPDALNFGATPIPGWGASYKLSGLAAGLNVLVFDKKGKKWAAGVPRFGMVGDGVYVYDPRQDSSFPGGSGGCTALVESTYAGSAAAENPGCHGVTYALGRFQNGKKVFGVGLPIDGIDWPAWVEFMNLCDANGWKVGGVIYEPDSRWANLKRICAAGGAVPCFVGGKLSVRFPRPRVALDTIRLADLADGEVQVPAGKSFKGRLNGLIPKYRSEANKWEFVQSALVSVPEYVTADGEAKSEERQIDLCQDKDQAAQLIAYELTELREIDGIVLPLKPRFLSYKLGDALDIGADLAAETGLAAGQLVTVTGRSVDPATAIVTLTLSTETTAKHAFALGQTGTAPPPATLVTGEEADDQVSLPTDDALQTIIRNSYPVPGSITIEGRDNAGDGEIEISDHARDYPGAQGDLSIVGATLTGLDLGETYHLYYDDATLTDTTPSFAASTVYADALNSTANPYRHYLGVVTLPGLGDPPSGGSGGGGGYGGGGQLN